MRSSNPIRPRSILARLAAALAMLALGAVRGPAAAAAHAPLPPAELEAFVDGVVGDAMRTDHIAGAAVTVVQDGKVVLLKGYGVSHLPAQPVDPRRTRFAIASMSKTFTWIAVLREVERGRIRLDAPINGYLPKDLQFDDRGFSRPIRMSDLMAHAAGFEDNDLDAMPATDDPSKLIPLQEQLRRNKPRRVREPGVTASYSNYGVALAGYIVERVSGQDYATYAERELFGPLGMASTTFREAYPPRAGLIAPMPAAMAAAKSDGFLWRNGTYEPQRPELLGPIGPAGSISTTAEDVGRYMLMQLAEGSLDGARIYGPQAARLLRTPVLDTPEGISGWAHGLIVTPLAGGHPGYGHGGAGNTFFTYMTLVPDLNLGIFVTTNTSTGRRLILRFADLVVGRFYGEGVPIARKPDPRLARDPDLYTGAYLTTRRGYGGLSQWFSRLVEPQAVTVTPRGDLRTGEGEGARIWLPDGRPGSFRAVDNGERLVFRFDAAGRPTAFQTGLNLATMERLGGVHDPRLFKLFAAFALLASLASLLGAGFAWGRARPATPVQAWASRLVLAASALWLLWAVSTAVGALVQSDDYYTWPWSGLVIGSWAALLAAAVALGLVVLAPWVLRGGPQGWSAWRKGAHLGAVAIFAGLAIILAAWSALTPWA